MNANQIDYIFNDCAEAVTDVNDLSGLSNQSIYISGASGFIGSWLLEFIRYLNLEYELNINVVASSRNWDDFKLHRSHLFNEKNFSFIEQDVRNYVEIPQECCYVIHLAATPDKRIHASDPLKVVDTIVTGISNVLDAACNVQNIKKVLNFSSGYIYGNQPVDVTGESKNKFWSLNCASISATYAESKRMAETICHIYRSQKRLPIYMVRPYAFIGPYQLLDRPWAINNFIRDAMQGDRVRILGNKETTRSYMYPSDMAYWVLRFLLIADDGSVLDLGSPHGYSLDEVVKIVTSNFSRSISIETQCDTTAHTKTKFVPVFNKRQDRDGFCVTVSLHESIRKTIEWFDLGSE